MGKVIVCQAQNPIHLVNSKIRDLTISYHAHRIGPFAFLHHEYRWRVLSAFATHFHLCLLQQGNL